MRVINMEIARMALSGQFSNATITCSDGAFRAPAWLLAITSNSLYDALREAQEEEEHVVSPDTTVAEVKNQLMARLFEGLEQQVSMDCDDNHGM